MSDKGRKEISLQDIKLLLKKEREKNFFCLDLLSLINILFEDSSWKEKGEEERNKYKE